jgi:hypothetical protein
MSDRTPSISVIDLVVLLFQPHPLPPSCQDCLECLRLISHLRFDLLGPYRMVLGGLPLQRPGLVLHNEKERLEVRTRGKQSKTLKVYYLQGRQ